MATAIDAPSSSSARGQSRGGAWTWLEERLEAERDQLPLWIPVALGIGIATWFALPSMASWLAVLLIACALAVAGIATGQGSRSGRAMIWLGALIAFGLLLIWWRAERIAAPVLARPIVESFEARVIEVERLPAREAVRMLVEPLATPTLPPRVRVNVEETKAPEGLRSGAIVRLRARLMPPPDAAVPGAYDFQRRAWFDRIGATGRALDSPVIVRAEQPLFWADLRQRLSAHILSQLGGGEGAIAAALATGDQGALPDADAEAMRASGLAHLLSVSGLHITAVVGLTMLLVLKTLALSPSLALRWPLLLIAAGAGALAGVAYTFLTGAEVPTIRSMVAALLVLIGIAIGRDAITLRLVAAGALFVLLLWPESLVGPSFQLSFAAITAIVALLEHPHIRALLSRRDEGLSARTGRLLLGLLLTGLAVEIALAPIAIYHFHKAGLYGALANIAAIPLTTFVIMPLEALALLFDLAGMGAPFWWLTGQALGLLLWLAHAVAAAPGAVAALPSIPVGAFALMVSGGIWICLWRTGWRGLGAAPLLVGALWALATPTPDILVTNDGRHLAVRTSEGGYALLRERAGDYVRDVLAESAGFQGELSDFDALPGARCSADSCSVELIRGTRRWRLLAMRSNYFVEPGPLRRSCADADIVVSERWLPDWCRPRWLKLDRSLLRRTGGLSIVLADQRVTTVRIDGDAHPWIDPPRPVKKLYPSPARREGLSTAGADPPVGPGPEPGSAGSAADRRSDSPDRAGPSRPRGGNI